VKNIVLGLLLIVCTYSCKTSKLPKLEDQASYIAQPYIDDFFEHYADKKGLGNKPTIEENTSAQLPDCKGPHDIIFLISYHNLPAAYREQLKQSANELSCIYNGKDLYNNYILPWQVLHTLSHRLYSSHRANNLSYWEEESRVNRAAIKMIAAHGYYEMQKNCILAVSRLYVKQTQMDNDPFFWEKENISDYKDLAYFHSRNLVEAWAFVEKYKDAAKPRLKEVTY